MFTGSKFVRDIPIQRRMQCVSGNFQTWKTQCIQGRTFSTINFQLPTLFFLRLLAR